MSRTLGNRQGIGNCLDFIISNFTSSTHLYSLGLIHTLRNSYVFITSNVWARVINMLTTNITCTAQQLPTW